MLGPVLRAVVFDMDGLLIDSEPLWVEAEIEVFARIGRALTPEQCAATTGLRIDEVVAYRWREQPWRNASAEEVTQQIVAGVVARVRTRGEPKPGVAQALAFVRERGVRVALASSSPGALIDAVLERLSLVGAFDAVHSAQHEPYGKPHPAVYLSVVKRLGLDPMACVALEDSLNGVIAAKAARMRCVAVPDGPAVGDPRFALADCVLPSLERLDLAVWNALGR